MAGLDDLYGPGADASLRAAVALDDAFGEPEIADSTQPDGSVVYEVRWGESRMLIRCEATRIHYISLESEAPGLYTALCNTLPDWARDHGVETFTASAKDEGTAAVLQTRGEWEPNPEDDLDLEWTI